MFFKNKIEKQFLFRTAAAVLFVGLGTGVTTTAASEQPLQTTATYGDWTVRCRPTPNQDETLCEMIQVVPAKNRQGTVANLAVGRLPGDDAIRLVVQLPIGVHLPAGVTVRIGEADIAQAEFQSCFTNFCLARATLDEDVVVMMKDASKMTMSFQDRAQRSAAIDVSLEGFTAAHDATLEAGS